VSKKISVNVMIRRLHHKEMKKRPLYKIRSNDFGFVRNSASDIWRVSDVQVGGSELAVAQEPTFKQQDVANLLSEKEL